ncbi:DNA primase, partial [candidate division KSB1 bacterium]
MAIPPEKIEEIRNYVDITEIVSEYIKLKRVGRNYFGLCPFHNEKSPSFSVNPEKQIFHCFGCGAGGNAFSFLQKIGNLTFIEAVENLAKRAGIKIEKYYKKADKDFKADNFYEANEFAAKLHIKTLNSPKGKKALEYIKSRGYNEKTLKMFGIGFAPDEWDSLIKAAEKEGIKKQFLEKCGLLIYHEEKKSYYDRFRNRIIFPILSEFGRVIAFGARILKDVKDQPKYINSPETVIYKKGKTLYGLYQNRKSIKKKNFALLVEGYTDVLSLYQNGVDFAVASLGTSLTEDQSRVLSRYTDNIGVLYDSDEAGQRAALRGADILLNIDLEVSVIPLQSGEDPDSFIKKYGTEKFLEMVDNAIPFIDFYFDNKLKKKENLSVKEKVDSSKEILEILGKIKNHLKRDILTGELAKKLGVSKEILYPELQREIKKQKGYAGSPKKVIADFYSSDARELELLSFGIIRKDIFRHLYKSVKEDFPLSKNADSLLETVADYYKNNEELKESKLLNYAEEEQKTNIMHVIKNLPKIPDGWGEDKFHEQCLNTVNEILRSFKMDRITEKISLLK